MFFIVETTQYKETQNTTTSFGYDRAYEHYEEAEQDLGALVINRLPEGDEVQVIKGPTPDTVNIFSTEKIITLSIEVLNKKGENK